MNDCTPAPINWNNLTHAYHNRPLDELFKTSYDCGKHPHGGVYFTASFKRLYGKVWATLTPETRDLDKKGKLKNVTRHTNMVSGRWLKLRKAKKAA